ncbi:hypothetical protein D3P96_01705 [Weissella viridescens]|uniref:Uncharacterized protein n=1 Tax=Weissella viridescens TaxID=1629 RepID=A0A3P2RGN6_WEIVI|nr:hypothetical protein D3P96_01705 [Weissella viridescens]
MTQDYEWEVVDYAETNNFRYYSVTSIIESDFGLTFWLFQALMLPKLIREMTNAYVAIKRVNFETKEKRHCESQ